MSTQQEAKEYLPFNLYDFFGYIIPGIYFSSILSIYFYTFYHQEFLSFLEKLSRAYHLLPFVSSFVFTIAYIVMVYVLGHFVATVSHIVIDKILVSGTTGYPVLKLLKITQNKEHRYLYQMTYKILFILFMVMLFIPLIPNPKEKFNWIFFTFCGFLFIRILSVIMQLLFPSFFKWIINSKIYSSNIKWWSEHINVPFKVIHMMLQTNHEFDEGFINKTKEKFKKDFELDAEASGSNNYWLPFFRLSSLNSYHAHLINNWLLLYGFSRNMSAASYLFSSMLVIIWAYNGYAFPNSELLGVDSSFFFKVSLGISTVLGLFFLMRYWVIYYSYFTKSILRSYYVTSFKDTEV